MSERLTDDHLETILRGCGPQAWPILKHSEIIALIEEVRASRAGRRWPGYRILIHGQLSGWSHSTREQAESEKTANSWHSGEVIPGHFVESVTP